MSNRMYPAAKVLFLKGDLDLENDTIKAALIDTADVTYNAAHDFLDDVISGVVGTPVALTSKTFTAGVFDAADAVLTAVSGDGTEAVLLYKDTGANGTSPLLLWIDTGSGLSVTPNGGNITIQWHASGIFAFTDV